MSSAAFLAGQSPAQSSLADALFTRVQQRVLGILFSRPQESFLVTEVIRRAGVGTGAVHRELGRLRRAGLVTVAVTGRQKAYQADPGSPIFAELHGLVLKTVDLAESLREALLPVRERIHAAFVYGSVARGTDTARSDIDLMIIAEAVTHADVYGLLQDAERTVARRVTPTILTPQLWRARRTSEQHFVRAVAEQPKIFLVGSDADLA